MRELARRSFESGRHSVVWDGRNHTGAGVANGTYFCRLQVGNVSLMRKMTWLR